MTDKENSKPLDETSAKAIFGPAAGNNLSSLRSKLVYFINALLLLCLPIYVFVAMKGLPLLDHLYLFLGVTLTAAVLFVLVLQRASIIKYKSLHVTDRASVIKSRDNSSQKEATRKLIFEAMATSHSLVLINVLFVFAFLFLSYGICNTLPKPINYASSVLSPTMLMAYAYLF